MLKAELERNATPPLKLAVPSELGPSKNCTVPVAVAGEMAAVNFTLCPDTEGLTLEETEVDVLPCYRLVKPAKYCLRIRHHPRTQQSLNAIPPKGSRRSRLPDRLH
jgi:hypothetical protein